MSCTSAERQADRERSQQYQKDKAAASSTASGCQAKGTCAKQTEPVSPTDTTAPTTPIWEKYGYASAQGFECAGAVLNGGGWGFGLPGSCEGHEAAISAAWDQMCADVARSGGQDLGCVAPELRPKPCGMGCEIQKVEIISLFDPTGASNGVLAVYYCANGDAGGCVVNLLAMIPLAGKGLKYADEGLKLGVEGLKLVGDSKLLAANLENIGFLRLEGEAAHHMVLANSPGAADARSVLEGFGININDAANGVFLPGNLSKPNPFGSSVHSTVHTDLYIAQINKSMLTFQSKAEVLDYLEYLRYLLQSGRPPGS